MQTARDVLSAVVSGDNGDDVVDVVRDTRRRAKGSCLRIDQVDLFPLLPRLAFWRRLPDTSRALAVSFSVTLNSVASTRT